MTKRGANRNRLSGAEVLLACLGYIVTVALVGLVSMGAGLLILVPWTLLSHGI